MTARRRTALKRPRGKLRPAAHEPGRGACVREAADGKTVWSWHPLLVSSRRRCVGPNRAIDHRQFAGDGGKTNSSPGRARHKPLKPLRREGRVFRRTCGPSCAFLRMTAGAEGTRLSLHPLLSRGHRQMNNFGRHPRREIAMSYPLASHIQKTTRSTSTRHRPPPAPVCDAGPLFAARAD